MKGQVLSQLRVIPSVRQPSRRDSAPLPLLPCAYRQRRHVVEVTHDIIAEGTGVEPYTPWPLSRPGSSPRCDVRRTPCPSVVGAERVMPGGPLDGGLPPEGFVLSDYRYSSHKRIGGR